MRNTAITVTLLATGAALALPFSVVSGIHGIANYLPLHNLFETFTTVVAMLIFAVGWNANSPRLPRNISLLSCAFFGVGLLNFGHMLSYGGMPDFVTPSNPEKAIDFWLAGRLLATVALLSAITLSPRPFASARTRYLLLTAVTGATVLWYWLVLFHQEELPHTFIPEQGLTAFKIYSEYAIIALNLAAAVALWARRHTPQPFNTAALFGGACTMALGEYFFTLYASVTDIFNLFGHVYAVIAYLFFYRAIFVTAMEAPYRQLQLSESKLRGTLDAIPDLVWLKDPEGIYIECNKSFERFSGAAKANIVGKTDYDFVGKELADSFREHDRKAVVAGKPSINEEWVTFAGDGYRGLFETVKTPMYDEAGKLIGVLGIAHDITERKNIEAKIVRLNQAYRLLSRVNEAIVRSQDRSQLFSAISDAAIESGLFRFTWIGILNETRVVPVTHAGIEEGYLSGKYRIFLDDERTGYGPTGRAIREGTHVVCQDIEHDPSMEPWRDEAIKRGFRASAAFPISEAGRVVGAINVYATETHFFTPDIVKLMQELAADISFSLDFFAGKIRREEAEAGLKQLNLELERRVLERTRQLELANKELEAFSYSVSHDLRAPLRSIDGFSQVLLTTCRDRLDATGIDYLHRVCRASQRMGHLIDDLLHLSQVTRSPLRREPVDLSGIAEHVADDLRKTNPGRQVRFILQSGLSAQGDPGLLHIVLDNLLGNAFKYTGKKPDAEIAFGRREIDGRGVYFVRDNGDGFNMDYAHKLFGTFQRLHEADEFEGTGIGLATVQRIIHRHNGKVWAEGIEGQGATFYFTLPQRERENMRLQNEA
jgi:PAS domain S-box-containing protein